MFKIEIKNLQNVLTNQAQFSTRAECVDWAESVKITNAFGKLEREVLEVADGILENNEDIAKSESVREVNMLDGRVCKYHKLPQEFSQEITDITVVCAAQQESEKALKYLVETDWMISRKVETGKELPEEVKKARAEARLKVL